MGQNCYSSTWIFAYAEMTQQSYESLWHFCEGLQSLHTHHDHQQQRRVWRRHGYDRRKWGWADFQHQCAGRLNTTLTNNTVLEMTANGGFAATFSPLAGSGAVCLDIRNNIFDATGFTFPISDMFSSMITVCSEKSS